MGRDVQCLASQALHLQECLPPTTQKAGDKFCPDRLARDATTLSSTLPEHRAGRDHSVASTDVPTDSHMEVGAIFKSSVQPTKSISVHMRDSTHKKTYCNNSHQVSVDTMLVTRGSS